MYHTLVFPVVLSLLVTATSLTGCESADAVSAEGPAAEELMFEGNMQIVVEQIGAMAVEPLSDDESHALVWMREEEKLARDVYAALSAQWKRPIFANISRSEQTHMDAVLALLRKYKIPDPVEGKASGVFADETLQNLYTTLVERGLKSEAEALTVGCLIEELDITDLQKHTAVTDNADILLVFRNLTKGSRNHLRAFNRNLIAAGVTYTPQYLSQDAYDAIANSPMERGRAQ
ncbi:MAG TPA: DUF2202 domain-containing protein [Bacteroidota bacterium]|nr:DUF2202 domain-containing protein [Bacteroidota bacterium]